MPQANPIGPAPIITISNLFLIDAPVTSRLYLLLNVTGTLVNVYSTNLIIQNQKKRF